MTPMIDIVFQLLIFFMLWKFAGPMAKKSFAARTERIQKELDAAAADKVAAGSEAAGIRAAKIDSPRGTFTMSAGHNPIQTIWLREARNGENKVIGAAAEALADPGTADVALRV